MPQIRTQAYHMLNEHVICEIPISIICGTRGDDTTQASIHNSTYLNVSNIALGFSELNVCKVIPIDLLVGSMQSVKGGVKTYLVFRSREVAIMFLSSIVLNTMLAQVFSI